MIVCACMGPQDGEPVCPCRMKSGSYRQEWVRFPALEGFIKFGGICEKHLSSLPCSYCTEGIPPLTFTGLTND